MKNIEIKAKTRNPERIRNILKRENANKIDILKQKDTYFNSSISRLKLREINNEKFVLIQYERADKKKAKVSNYSIYKTNSPDQLKKCLIQSLGIKIIVEKIREIYQIENTRIHLDTVKGLGTFIELETVVKYDSQMDTFHKENKKIQKLLNISLEDLIEGSYSNLLLDSES